MKLHEIANEYQFLLEHGDSDSVHQDLDQIKAPLENKAINLAKYLSSLKANVNAINDEIDRLTKLKKAIVNREQSLIDYLDVNMRKCGIEKIESPLFKIAYKKCPCSVDIVNADEIPDEYKKIKTEVVIDKLKLKDEMKLGVVIPGATLKQNIKLEIK